MGTFRLLSCAVLPAAVLAGCASVSVKDVEKAAAKPKAKPAAIYVMDFDTRSAEFNVDREGAELAQFKADTAKILSDLLVERLGSRLEVKALRVTSSANLPKSGWLLTGRFIRVNQGSRALRTIVGLGAGGTKMETEVLLHDLAVSQKRTFLKFATTGGSNAEPGVLTSPGPVSAGMSLIKQTMRGITEDATRTAREITASLSEYMLERRWITEEQALRAKKLGETPPLDQSLQIP